ncbi:MAG: HlyD family efflux transporter periplasmic adaptor subunit, partial [Phycisphaerales bacterium]|nr:HlyD family efflux transporter periplasmic adaptor subunit [Phycisphaerales bacterium]
RRAQDHLDTRIVLIPRAYGFVAACLLFCLAVTGYWALFGSVPIKTSGSGMIVEKGRQLLAVQSESEGRVRSIVAAEGDTVGANDILVHLSQDDLEIEISEARNAVQDLSSNFKALKQRLAGEIQAREKTFAALQATYSKSITELEQNRDALIGLLSDDAGTDAGSSSLHGESLSYRQFYQSTLIQLTALRTQLADARQRLADLRVDAATETEKAEEALNAHRRTLERLTAIHKVRSVIRAPEAGRIDEIRIVRGQTISPEKVAMTMSHGGAGFEVLAFLQLLDAKRVAVGMSAHVLPTTVSKAQFGTMRGKVTSISPGPISTEAANTLLQDRQMANRLSSEGLAYLTRITLDVDSNAPSGFRWWTGTGPPF